MYNDGMSLISVILSAIVLAWLDSYPFLCVRAWDLTPVLAGQASMHPARIATCGLIENKDAVNAWEVAISGSRG